MDRVKRDKERVRERVREEDVSKTVSRGGEHLDVPTACNRSGAPSHNCYII